MEWQGAGVSPEEIVQKPNEIIVYPNPLIPNSLRDGQAKILWLGEQISEGMEFVIFNIKGQKVRCIPGTTKLRGGKFQASWNLLDNEGLKVSSGIYFIRVKADDIYLAQRKITVIR